MDIFHAKSWAWGESADDKFRSDLNIHGLLGIIFSQLYYEAKQLRAYDRLGCKERVTWGRRRDR